jgi:hypothetical protein
VSSLTVTARRALALLMVPLALAACGGGSSSGDPSSENYDPAHTTLKDAGLEVCGDANTQIPQNLGSGPGLQNSRAFFVASDCMGKETSPDTAMVFQFDSKQAVDAGYANVKAAMPNGSSEKYGPLILVTTGPNRQANLAAIDQALQKTYPTTTS